nr:MAG TPA: hypothetical protein [Caudoviricetes sp.]
MSTNNTIDKIGNIYFKEWKAGFDGNICGVKGIYPTITLSNNTGGTVRVCLKRTHVWSVCISSVSVLLTPYGLIPTISNSVGVSSIPFSQELVAETIIT